MSGVEQFLDMSFWHALDVVFLGFVGGVLGGFLGTGGAFIMTPGMMNLGVPGVIAVGSNLTHKFGKSLMASRQRAAFGHVDRKLGFANMVPVLIGVAAASWLNQYLSRLDPAGSGASHGVIGDLYISALFVVVLSVISVAMLVDAHRFGRRDVIRTGKVSLAERFARFRVPPMVHFPVADVTLSFWVVAVIGLLSGYLAGAIGVGGFLGVPAMIYIMGVPTAVAAGTQTFLQIFMGAFGALSYAWNGYVDLRLTFLLYLGSLVGVYIGAYGMKMVQDRVFRMTTGLIILTSVFSRLASIPDYLDRLGYISLPDSAIVGLNLASKIILFGGSSAGVLFILLKVARAYRRRKRVRRMIEGPRAVSS